MSLSIAEELYVQSLGWEVLRYLKREEGKLLSLYREADSEALRVLEEIRRVLDDDTLDDPDCFKRIEAIVKAFHAHEISTSRHDWG